MAVIMLFGTVELKLDGIALIERDGTVDSTPNTPTSRLRRWATTAAGRR